MFALMAWLHFNPDSSYNSPSSTQHTGVTWLQHSGHTTTQGVQHPRLCTHRAVSMTHRSPITNTSRVRWNRTKRHLPGRTIEGSTCTLREHVSKLKMTNSKPPKEKASASQCLTTKKFRGDKGPSKRISKRSENPSHPEQSGLVTLGCRKRQSKTWLTVGTVLCFCLIYFLFEMFWKY